MLTRDEHDADAPLAQRQIVEVFDNVAYRLEHAPLRSSVGTSSNVRSINAPVSINWNSTVRIATRSPPRRSATPLPSPHSLNSPN